MTHLSTPDLIRALGGADAICPPGCTCRGKYSGPERRSVHRDADYEREAAAREAITRRQLGAGAGAMIRNLTFVLICMVAAWDWFAVLILLLALARAGRS